MPLDANNETSWFNLKKIRKFNETLDLFFFLTCCDIFMADSLLWLLATGLSTLDLDQPSQSFYPGGTLEIIFRSQGTPE
jgi:hypothetical protein